MVLQLVWADWRAVENNLVYWRKIWLETDSKLVVQAFSSKSLTMPWKLRQGWYHCLLITKSMDFSSSHIYRVDKLANIGLSAQHLTVFSYVHEDIREDFVRNKRGLPSFRFVAYWDFGLCPPSFSSWCTLVTFSFNYIMGSSLLPFCKKKTHTHTCK
jgi:hypothetical protein